MRPVKDAECQFIPAEALTIGDLDGDAQQRSRGGQIYDMFIPDTSDNCPHPSIRNRPNGHITGDLFEQVQPGYWAFRMSASYFRL